MKEREEHIEFAMNYCQHYDGARGPTCKAGCNRREIQKHAVPSSTLRVGPCMSGHLFPDVLTLCPKWERVTREAAEKRADSIERSMHRMTVVSPFISAWRKKPWGKAEVVECPSCKGRLHLEQSSYNGHVRARCETNDCINFIE